MIPDIISKLTAELTTGISTEVQVVYLLAGIRKILEQQETEAYEELEFHCDWALHARLKGTKAQEILKIFDAANVLFAQGTELHDLPEPLKGSIQKISKMDLFEEELSKFLSNNDLPNLGVRGDGWVRFLHLYTKVIEDCPLVIRGDSQLGIKKVTLNVEESQKHPKGQFYFKVNWTITDATDKNRTVFIINSFDTEQPQQDAK